MSNDKLFSEREGHTKQSGIQTDDLDYKTRIAIYNSVFGAFLQSEEVNGCRNHDVINRITPLSEFWKNFWTEFLENSLDEISYRYSSLGSYMKSHIIGMEHPYHEILSLIEFITRNFLPDDSIFQKKFAEEINEALKKKNTGFRLINKIITKVTDKEQIQEIKKAASSPLDTVNKHLQKAQELMSAESPDYENSIAESVKAVESLCKKIVDDDNATLGKALDMIKDKGNIELPTSLRGAFDKIYGWSSSEQGIRHALSEMPKDKLDIEEARFMLVSCSAFVCYLLDECIKAGIKLKSG